MWIRSITKITSMEEADKQYFYLKKTVQQGYNKGEGLIIQYIANLNCSSKKHFGPTWRKAGVISGIQFHDGFLYGIEDENGTLTGWWKCMIKLGYIIMIMFPFSNAVST